MLAATPTQPMTLPGLSMAKKARKTRTDFSRKPNPDLNAAGCREYGDWLVKRASKIRDHAIRAADHLDTVGPDETIHPIVSLVEKLFDEIEERIVTQMLGKAEGVARAHRIKRESDA